MAISNFLQDPMGLASLSMAQGVSPGEAILQGQKQVAFQQQQAAAQQKAQRMAQIEQRLPELLQNIDINNPTAAMGRLIQEGVPIEIAQQLIGTVQKQAQQQGLNKQREIMADYMAGGSTQGIGTGEGDRMRAHVLAQSYDPLQRAAGKAMLEEIDIAEKSKAGTIEAVIEMKQSLDKAGLMLENLQGLKGHEGLSAVVGAPNPFKGGFGAFEVPGSPASDFAKRLDQIQGGVFMTAYEGLKGGGQITEVEGKKAEASITRINKAQSEDEFNTALDEFIGIVEQARDRALEKANKMGVDTSGIDVATTPKSDTLESLSDDEIEFLRSEGLLDGA